MNTVKIRIIGAASTLALSAILPDPAGALIRKCVGPGGDVKFTNSECPEGYALEASRAASPPTSAGEAEDPDICRFSSILEAAEVSPAIAEAESHLARAKEKGMTILPCTGRTAWGGYGRGRRNCSPAPGHRPRRAPRRNAGRGPLNTVKGECISPVPHAHPATA